MSKPPRPTEMRARSGPLRWLLDRATSSFARTATAVVLVLGALAATVAVGLTLASSRSWTSTEEFAPQLSLLDGGNGTNVYSLNIDGAKRFVDAQVALLKGRDVLGPVAANVKESYDDLASVVDVHAGSSGATVVVSVRDPEPARAQALTQAVVDSYTTVRSAQVRALAQGQADALSDQLDEQRRLGLSGSELAAQLQRDLAQLYVPLKAEPSSVLTVVSSASTPTPTPRGTAKVLVIAFLGTAALASAVLLGLRVVSDRILGPRDVPVSPGVVSVGLLRSHDPLEVASGYAAALLATAATHPECLLVLSATPEDLDEQAATALTAGLVASGRPARRLSLLSHAPGGAQSGPLAVVAGGWASQVPELLQGLDASTVVCVVARQGVHRSELEAALASVRQVCALPLGVLLLAGRSLP